MSGRVRFWVIAGTLFTILFSCCGLLDWLGSVAICHGTGSVAYNFSRTCHSEIYAGLFFIGDFLLFIGLFYLLTCERVRRGIKYLALMAFIPYGLFVICIPNVIWDLPYFTTLHFPPGVARTAWNAHDARQHRCLKRILSYPSSDFRSRN